MNEPGPNPAPIPPPHFSSGYFRDPSAAEATRQLGRGLIGHVLIVAILLILLGILELAFALFCLLFALLALALPRNAVGNVEFIAALYGTIGALAAVSGTARIAAGWFNLRFRRRKLGIAALGIGLAAVFTGLCAPTAIGLAVYGLIVYLNDSVIAAFDLGDRGKSTTEINTAFPP